MVLPEELISLLFFSLRQRFHLVHLLLYPFVTILKLSRLLFDLSCLSFDILIHILHSLLLHLLLLKEVFRLCSYLFLLLGNLLAEIVRILTSARINQRLHVAWLASIAPLPYFYRVVAQVLIAHIRSHKHCLIHPPLTGTSCSDSLISCGFFR